MADLTIRMILDQVHRGQIRIPAFQRGFVWDSTMVAFLMDSIYKRYPFGSLLLWRTREGLKFERQLGPFVLPNRDPDYPIDYVLDGQQRITAIFGTFQTEIEPADLADWVDVYFDLGADLNAQESQFVPVEPESVDPRRHFPLKTLFDTVAYRRATEELGDKDRIQIDTMQTRFKETSIPHQLLSTEDRATVAIVFERINRTGVPLDTLQLLTAWTWSEEFDLQQHFDELREELEPFGFGDVGEDSNLLLRCCAAVLAHDAAPTTLVSLKGEDVRNRFDEIVNGIKGAIDFLRTNMRVETLDNLPFRPVLVPLSVFFGRPGNETVSVTDAQRAKMVRWFWRVCFSRRFSSGVLRNLKDDIVGMVALRDGRPTTIGDFQVLVTSEFFRENTFRINTVNTKTFILMLAQCNPKTFVSGQDVSLKAVLRNYNRSEFHHLFPRAYLTSLQVPTKEQNCLANFCFLSRADNTVLGGEAPSDYRSKMPPDVLPILESALCPDTLFDDDYADFIDERCDLLEDYANALIS